MGWPKGKPRNGTGNTGKGRPKGAKNKVKKDLVEQILEISADLDRQGLGLKDCAKQDPAWFHQNFLRGLIPKNIELNVEGELNVTWEKL